MKILSKSGFAAFVNALIQDTSRDVEGVKAKGPKFVFGPLDSASELRLDYDVTILPPKKYVLPQYENMMKFDIAQGKMVMTEQPKGKIIIGVHPYDIAAIMQMDKFYLDTHVDDGYLARRKNILIIGSNIQNVSEKGFYGAMGTSTVDSGYDLFITDLGDSYAIDIGTEAGGQLLGAACQRDATPEEAQKAKSINDGVAERSRRDLRVKPSSWHDILKKSFDSPVWKEQADKCLVCNSCTLVCPTCFCYDVTDEISLDMNTGLRKRTWDGCMLRDFTSIGSGEVFRENVEDRYRHRFNRKGMYLPDGFGFVACVGCGRCATQCVPDIADPVNLFNKLAAGTTALLAEKQLAPVGVSDLGAASGKGPLFVPMPATMKRVDKLTEDETLFEIGLDNGQPMNYQPGQFVEVSVMGIGEAPISISSAPGRDTFQLVVRNVGDVTNALHAMKAGDKVGIRGPFGTGFDTEGLKGKNLLFIGGGLGIVPMRSFINYVLDHRDDYGQVTILYGCKDPDALLFKDEIEEWDRRDDIQHMRTVDTCVEEENWDGEVGVITTIMPLVTFDPANTIGVVVGPPIMYRFVNKSLLSMGMPEENIIVSLERRMKCGVGKCGHCQINGIYVCKEGPVFNYKDVKQHPEAFE